MSELCKLSSGRLIIRREAVWSNTKCLNISSFEVSEPCIQLGLFQCLTKPKGFYAAGRIREQMLYCLTLTVLSGWAEWYKMQHHVLL